MGWLSKLFGGDEYDDDKARRQGNRIMSSDNSRLQERQDSVLANESVARLVSSEGRAELFQGIAGRLDKAYNNALMVGTGNMSRAGLGSGSASAMLRARMTKDRMESVNAATTQADVAAGQFVTGLFSDFRKEHLSANQMQLNFEAGVQGNVASSIASNNAISGGLLQGAGTALGGYLGAPAEGD